MSLAGTLSLACFIPREYHQDMMILYLSLLMPQTENLEISCFYHP